MPSSKDLAYVEAMTPTLGNARSMVRLTFQDLRAGSFPKPLETANPWNPKHIARQLRKLRVHPQTYSGWTLNGKLVAYMKQGEWCLEDEKPFASGARYLAIVQSLELCKNPSNGKWGVFGLVASEHLDAADQRMILNDLLKRSFEDPLTGKPRTVTLPIHEHDPLLEIALSHGFVTVWQKGKAADVPGLMQQCYQRA